MDLSERIAEAKRRKQVADEAITEADRLEIAQRQQLAEIEGEAKLVELKRRQLDLDRRVDIARSNLGPEIPVRGILMEDYNDSFVVIADGAAHAKWSNSIAMFNATGKGDRLEIGREYARSVVYDWDGQIFDDQSSELTHKLEVRLTEKPGFVSPITNAAADLAGVFAEARKS
jgi:hypothetical protein